MDWKKSKIRQQWSKFCAKLPTAHGHQHDASCAASSSHTPHDHSHDHSHHHSHHHSPQAFDRAFFISTVANAVFVMVQIVAALLANSTSLLADAVHNFGDVLSLVLAGVANRLLQRHPTAKTSYGMKKTSILAALTNGVLLVFSCGVIATEAVYKLFSPSPVYVLPVIIVASLGIVVNGGTAALFLRGREDLNIRGAYLHLLYDAWISVGVVLSALLLSWTHWLWIDPLVGLVFAVLFLKGTWGLFADSFHLIIDAVPKKISLIGVHDFLVQQPGVKQVHDLHIWALSTQENAMSVHLWMPDGALTDKARQQLVHTLKSQFHIHHSTIQVEKELVFCEDVCRSSPPSM